MGPLGHVLRKYLNGKALAGGYSWNVDAISTYVEGVTYALLIVPAIAYVITKSLLTAMLLAPIPALPVLLTMAWAQYSVDSVRNNIEWELPFFAILLDIVHDVGGNVTHAFEVSGKVGLRWISREWSIINRYALTTNSITRAMQLRARVHPSPEFQRFINGYVSVWTYTGDVAGYVRNVEDTYVSVLSNRLSALTRQVIDIVLAIASSLTIMVLFMIVMMVLGVGSSIMYVLPAIALIAPAIIARVYLSIPYIIRINITHNKGLITALMATSILSTALLLHYGVYGVVALALPPLTFSIFVTKSVNELRASILALPDLLRDVSEMVKAGVGIGTALERVLNNQYPDPLLNHLRKITRFNDVEIGAPWIMKYVLGILRELSSLGSPSRALDKLVKVLLDMKALMTSISYNARSLQALNYSLPFIFAGITLASKFVISMLNSVIESAPYTLVGFVIPGISAVLLPLMITAYIISLSLAILSSLLNNLTLDPTVKFVAPVPLTLILMLIVTEVQVPV